MINLTNMIFKDDNFKVAFMKLFGSEMNHKAYYSVKRIMDKMGERGREVEAADAEIRKKYLITMTTDELVEEEGKPSYYKTKLDWVDKDKANEEFKTLFTQPFDIEVSKVWAVDLSHLKFTPAEWQTLEPIIADIDNITRG